MTTTKRITNKQQLRALARELGVRPDWHEPDEQEVTVTVKGNIFVNAGFWPDAEDVPGTNRTLHEKHVLIKQDGKLIAAVNLATLFAMACGDSGVDAE